MNGFKFCVLGSGSSGNASVLRSGNNWVMIDCGFSIKQTKERLKRAGLALADIHDFVLTHVDRDHFNPVWCRTIQTHGINVHMHRLHVPRAMSLGLQAKNIVAFDGAFKLHNCVVEPIHVAHDELGTFSYVFDSGNERFGLATDLGYVPEHLLTSFHNLDIVAFESNYDPFMQETSGRPQFLKERIMNGSGHLSNAQSLCTIQKIASQSSLSHIVLLHLSRQCNAPRHIYELYEEHATELKPLVTISHQDHPTPMLQVSEAVKIVQEVLF